MSESKGFEEEIQLEFVRSYMEFLEKAVLDPNAKVSMSDAKEIVEKIREGNRFEKMMYSFIMVVADRDPEMEIRVVISKRMQEFIRYIHQRYQRAKIYKGGKNPELLGAPIVIRDILVPRMEQIWQTLQTIQSSDGNWYEMRKHVDGYLDVRKVKKP